MEEMSEKDVKKEGERVQAIEEKLRFMIHGPAGLELCCQGGVCVYE